MTSERADESCDLVLERELDVSASLVWACWTEPERVVKWFTPAPWQTVSCEIDLQPGGRFSTVMQSPEGEQFPNEGCILEVVPERRLTWTSVLTAGFRPTSPQNGADDLAFTATIELEPTGTGTRYRATAKHPDAATAQRHREMGFHEGWGAALDQLVALCS
jgi:uncharacterized protein YndB with AHSA1/START domain